MKRISLVTAAIICLLTLTLFYFGGQVPRSFALAPRPEPTPGKVDMAAFTKAATTQQRINRYFHGDVVSKLGGCWSRLQGKGAVAFKYTYNKAGASWALGTVEVSSSTLPKGQDAAALKCMQDAARGTSFPTDPTEPGATSYVLNWRWPVPFPVDAEARKNAMFLPIGGGGGEGGGGCDGDGAAAGCFNCGKNFFGQNACLKVCVGYAKCTVTSSKDGDSCAAFNRCASGGPFGHISGGGLIGALVHEHDLFETASSCSTRLPVFSDPSALTTDE